MFNDRIEITSTGGLPDGLSEEEFFEGFSVPRNKEIMRIYKDLDLVEQLGSGIPRILESYSKECFRFSENFLRMSFPINDQANDQANDQVGRISYQVREAEVEYLGGPIGGPMGGPIDKLTDRQQEVLQLLIANNRLSKRELATILNINVSAAQAHIDTLRGKGYIARVGGTRGYWTILR